MRMKAEGDVRVFGGVLRRLGDLYLVEGLLFFPGTDDIGKFDRIVIEPAPGEFIHAVTADAAIERIGNQHGVVDRRDINSMARDIPIIETFRGVLPFLATDLLRVLLVFFVPATTLFLVHVL